MRGRVALHEKETALLHRTQDTQRQRLFHSSRADVLEQAGLADNFAGFEIHVGIVIQIGQSQDDISPRAAQVIISWYFIFCRIITSGTKNNIYETCFSSCSPRVGRIMPAR